MQDPQVPIDHPVQVVNTGSAHDDPRTPEPGVALSLSGGGYRAMLFHIGALWRLNELGQLKALKRISSVSGGSITAAMLGLKWSTLGFAADNVAANYVSNVVAPIRRLASTTIDRAAILKGVFTPGSISDKVANAYREHLFGDATLQALPDDASGPRFVINATSVQTGALFRFSRPYIADYRVGRILNPTVELAVAVAASSAFPPVLSPCAIQFDPSAWVASGAEDCKGEPYTSRAVLSDGGVYDNLGLETTWKRYETILVSNGGGKMAATATPHADWARHAIRINEIIDNQVRSLRARQVIESFKAGMRKGAYWGIRTDIAAFGVAGALPCPLEQTTALAETPTRLKELPNVGQERLINWGYAVCDAGMRRHVSTSATPPAQFPYPASGVG
jgi:NTE family protein